MENHQQSGSPEQISLDNIRHNLSNIKPIASEISHLWSTYLAESMAVAMQKHMVAKAKDPDLRGVLQLSLDSASKNVQAMEDIFKSIQHPIPDGFTEKDVDINAPQLFSEEYTVRYARLMNKYILMNHSVAFSESYRSDFRKLFSGFIDDTQELIERADEVLLSKGLLPKPPYTVIPDRVDYIHNKDYYGSIFGSDRPMNVFEISNIFHIMDFKVVIRAMILGMAQVVKSNKLKKYLLDVRQAIEKHLKVLGSLLESQGLSGPEFVDFHVTNSQESPYSDRLMLFHISVANAYIITKFGLGLTRVLRKDIALTLSRLMAEIIDLSKAGSELIIENGWLERIPEVVDRKELIH